MAEGWVSGETGWLMDQIDTEALVKEAAQPHSVIAFDPMTESYTVIGPYADAHAATLEAERIKVELNEAAGHADYPEIQTWIALHFPPNQG